MISITLSVVWPFELFEDHETLLPLLFHGKMSYVMLSPCASMHHVMHTIISKAFTIHLRVVLTWVRRIVMMDSRGGPCDQDQRRFLMVGLRRLGLINGVDIKFDVVVFLWDLTSLQRRQAPVHSTPLFYKFFITL